MTDTPIKILAFGAVSSSDLKRALAKARTINDKHGPFSVFLLFGAFLEDPQTAIEFLSGQLSAGIPTYIQGSVDTVKKLAGEGDLSDDITILEPNKIVDTPSGISLACEKNESTISHDPHRTVDIMISSLTPSNLDTNKSDITNSMLFTQKTRPKYYISSTENSSFTREWAPFKWDANSDRLCRMIQLASYGEKAKNVYAFSISKTEKNISQTGLRENPFKKTVTMSKGTKRNANDERKTMKRQKNHTVLPETCFFCLSNPNLDKSLIVSIGDESYLALAKGPLSSSDAMKILGFSGHLLTIPFAHVPTYSSLPASSAPSTLAEIKRYIEGVRLMFGVHGLKAVCYEISRSRGVHISTQIIPVKEEFLTSLEVSFKKKLENAGLQVSRDHIQEGENDYIYIDLGNDIDPIKGIIPAGIRLDMGLCRKIVAETLEIPEQNDWKKCVQSPEDEKKDKEICRTQFKNFDFTLID